MEEPAYPRVQRFRVNRTGRVIDINLDELEGAFSEHSPEATSYLDLETGDTPRVTEEVRRDLEALHTEGFGDRFITVEEESHDAYQDMARFIPTVADERIQERLWRAIDGTRPFRRFKDVLEEYPAERKRWFDFEAVLRRQRLIAWLAEEGIEPVPEPTE